MDNTNPTTNLVGIWWYMKKLINIPDQIYKKMLKVKAETGQPIMAQIREILINHYNR